jgi:accessory gene regulator protein AgrB
MQEIFHHIFYLVISPYIFEYLLFSFFKSKTTQAPLLSHHHKKKKKKTTLKRLVGGCIRREYE